MDDLIANLKSQLATVEAEYASLKGGRKSASPRLRKSLMSIKNTSHLMRSSTTQLVKGLPTKSRKQVKQDEPKIESEVKVEETKIEEPIAKVKKSRAKKVVSSPESLETSA